MLRKSVMHRIVAYFYASISSFFNKIPFFILILMIKGMLPTEVEGLFHQLLNIWACTEWAGKVTIFYIDTA